MSFVLYARFSLGVLLVCDCFICESVGCFCVSLISESLFLVRFGVCHMCFICVFLLCFL